MGLLPFDPETTLQEKITCICLKPSGRCRAELGEANLQLNYKKSRYENDVLLQNEPINTNDANSNKAVHPEYKEEDIKELLIIGAGPHSLTLVLRLLEQDPDFMTDKERHEQAQYKTRMRPINQVNNHIRKLRRGPNAVFRKKKKPSLDTSCPPPLELNDILQKTAIIDAHGEWMQTWKENFATIGITQLRSLINAHADPYDHRSLEYYAEMMKRDGELITLKHLTQRDKDFNGPYQAPSTSVFEDFHELLIDAYGVRNAVQQGFVESIVPIENHYQENEPLFEVIVKDSQGNSQKMWSKRVVSSMGPNFTSKDSLVWDTFLKDSPIPVPKECVLRTHEIVPWLQQKQSDGPSKRVLIVGGGITSAQLALSALKSSWCNGVTLLQRSKSLQRQFDVKNEWMGKARGRLLDEFWSLDMKSRAKKLKEYRKGGSIPPETLKELHQVAVGRNSEMELREEVEISHVEYMDGKLHVSFDNDSCSEEYDMIWEATGSQNQLKKYPALFSLSHHLPIDEVSGLPCLGKDLSWNNDNMKDDEPQGKQKARARCWCMGVLAGLQLGPDALNLVGARHGAVRVAQAIRQDFAKSKEMNIS
ncbi:hypothetical protein CTEN210_09082 [Chaetoceros tenuissimus]|uniref:L-ornithine N(5)-monooxygenase [NAD(P)H] n=1 Tax=Chaetoceros tenuissimus TaxID=426638 RepID=A0AAD3H711_9STRA|nr:hypothetical protein CTEN210_09082 [Chaetoceros tenuissimus]